ncbi:MAG TPA: hypothetical protein VIX58_11875 [Anaerolineae bacterium]
MADLAPFEITAFTERLIDTGLELTDAEWEADMLQVIVHGVERLNQKLGHPRAVHLATGGVSLGLTLTGGGLAYPWWIVPWRRRIIFSVKTLRQSPDWRGQVAVVHELAHIWDAKQSNWLDRLLARGGPIVRAMLKYVGDEPGPTCYGGLGAPECGFARNPREEWAESVATYFYPEYIEWLQANKPAERTAGLRPKHRAFVELQIEQLRARFDVNI